MGLNSSNLGLPLFKQVIALEIYSYDDISDHYSDLDLWFFSSENLAN